MCFWLNSAEQNKFFFVIALIYPYFQSQLRFLKKYNFVFAGGGLSGLCTAYYLSLSGIDFESALILDRDEKNVDDRTWCFWSSLPAAFEGLVSHKWRQLGVAFEDFSRLERIGGNGYQLVRSLDFYRFVEDRLRSDGRFEWLQSGIRRMLPEGDGVRVELVGGGSVVGDRVFNSIPAFSGDTGLPARPSFLWQHFMGWVIETDAPVFDPSAPLLMDFFDGTELPDVHFYYLLPQSERKALVEYTVFSEAVFASGVYEEKLERYIRMKFGEGAYRITATERGAIPMTDRVFPQIEADRIFNIGTAGGWVKPSTGYAFVRTLERSKALVAALSEGKEKEVRLGSRSRFVFYDRLLLNILQEEGYRGGGIFRALFKRNRIVSVLKFLEERSNLLEEVRIFMRLPVRTFLRALVRVYLPRIFEGYQHYRAKLKIRFRYDF